MGETLIGSQRATFHALVMTVIPEAADLDDAGWEHVDLTVMGALAQRSARVQRQFALLLRVIEHAPRIARGRPFTRLDAPARTRVLERLQRSPVKLIRRGVWGARTLALMGYYTLPSVIRQVGYRAHVRGWQVRAVLP
jgi:hypothetical protein